MATRALVGRVGGHVWIVGDCGNGGVGSWSVVVALAKMLAEKKDGPTKVVIFLRGERGATETERVLDVVFRPLQVRYPTVIQLQVWSGQSPFESSSLAGAGISLACIVDAHSTLSWAQEVQRNEFAFDKVVLVLTNVARNTATLSSLAQRDAIRALEESCTNYSVLQVHGIVNEDPNYRNGQRAMVRMGCNPDCDSTEKPVSVSDLAGTMFSCLRPGLPRANETEAERLCRLPRVVLACYTYGPALHHGFMHRPKFPRQPQTYSPSVLRAPPTRWGSLKFDESRAPGSLFLRPNQRHPGKVCRNEKQKFGDGNFMPKDLRYANHLENHFFEK